ncbi:hypothetical protein WDJ51_08990 [Rathayibacter sp. YIM 133350]|uniref:hypothetical protein n=1 Tax=Rathayibacter sp. YIM 133350 TaxID=3131992 RepID=UPI00307D166E
MRDILVRRMPWVDAVEREGELLVLIGERVLLLSTLARAIVEATDAWTPVGEIVAMLEAEFGVPDGVDPDAVARAAIDALAADGVVALR